MRRFLRLDCPELDELRDNYQRATNMSLMAIGLGISWIITTCLLTIPIDGVLANVRGLPRVFAAVLAWGAATSGVLAAMLWLYAALSMHLLTRR